MTLPEPRCRNCGTALRDDEDGVWHHAAPLPSCPDPFPSERWLALAIAEDSREGQLLIMGDGGLIHELDEDDEVVGELLSNHAHALLSLTVLAELLAGLLPDAPEPAPQEPAEPQPATGEEPRPDGGNDE